MLQVFESYDIINDKQNVRINIFPFLSNNKYSLFLNDQMTAEQISKSFKMVAELIDADTGTEKAD
ncbi:MAG: hypothetical protein ABSC54_09520 [Smithellaceae bacterium]|jgi:hypothetical protein